MCWISSAASALTDVTQAVRDAYAYDAFGSNITAIGSTPNPHRRASSTCRCLFAARGSTATRIRT